MRVTNSYTAHRGESLLTWSAIYDRQKQLERTLLDWLAIRVIEYGMEHGFIPAAAPDGWRTLVSWDLPTMPPIDEKTSIDAQSAALKSGLTTYRELLGSDWEDHMRELAAELKLARELELPISPLETVSGAPAPTEENTNQSASADHNL